MTSDKDERRPPSRRIADDLRAQISDGTFGAGNKLPSERDLAARYGTARNTAKEAIDILRREGLVVARHGAGAFVREHVRCYDWAPTATRGLSERRRGFRGTALR